MTIERETLELWIGLEADGRLGPREAAQLAEHLADDEGARAYAAWLRGVRGALSGEAEPATPAGLRQRVLTRVAATRRVLAHRGAVLPLLRRVAVAAAVLVMAGALALFLEGFDSQRRGVLADDPLNQPTVEDHLRRFAGPPDAPAGEVSYVEFLRWRFTGRAN